MHTTRRLSFSIAAGLLLSIAAGCSDQGIVEPRDDAAGPVLTRSDTPQANDQACWGQASKVFAIMGKMGEHASGVGSPRIGLRNLAHELYMQGVIAEPTMQALGAFVAAAEGLSIEACL